MSFASQFLDYSSWTRDMDKQEEERKEKERIEREKCEKQVQMQKDNYIKKNGYFWTGPADVKIPLSIRRVPSLDRVNSTSYSLTDGGTCQVSNTVLGTNKQPYTTDEYREKFAIYTNGDWYWNMSNKNIKNSQKHFWNFL